MSIAKYSAHRVMKRAVGRRVSLDAAELVAKYLTKVASDIAIYAGRIAKESGRTVIKKKDVALVLEIMGVDLEELEKMEY